MTSEHNNNNNNRPYSYSPTALGRVDRSARRRGSCGEKKERKKERKLWQVMADLVEMEVNFKKRKVPVLKNTCGLEGYLSPTKKKEELLKLTEKAHKLGLELTDDGEPISDVVNAKLVTKDGTIPNSFKLYSDWSTDFSDTPNFAWGDLYCYSINKKGYDQESLKAYRSLEGYRLH